MASWSKITLVYNDIISETWINKLVEGYNIVKNTTYCPSNNTSVYSSPNYSSNKGSNNSVCGGNYSSDYNNAYHIWRGAGYS